MNTYLISSQASYFFQTFFVLFYILLTVHLGIIFVYNQLDAQFFFMYVYFCSLHVSGSHMPIIRRINCINTTSGICHSLYMTVWCAGLHLHNTIIVLCIYIYIYKLFFLFMKYFNIFLLISRLKPVKSGHTRIPSKDMILSNYKVPKGVPYFFDN
jgi:hypothetical protein